MTSTPDPQQRRPGPLSWFRTVLLIIQTVAVVIRTWHDL